VDHIAIPHLNAGDDEHPIWLQVNLA
jgi:hypothetical protein